MRLEYDGWCDGVYNYSGRVMITHEVGHSYTDAVVETASTLHAHFRTHVMALYRSGREYPICRGTHRCVIYAPTNFARALELTCRATSHRV